MRAKSELGILETRFKDLTASSEFTIQTVLSVDRYIVAAGAGANVLAIQHPTMPRKVSPQSLLILALSVLLGGMIGVAYVLIRTAIHNRK